MRSLLLFLAALAVGAFMVPSGSPVTWAKAAPANGFAVPPISLRFQRFHLPSRRRFALHPEGSRLVDGAGKPFRIAGVNWYGAEEESFVPGGLDQQTDLAILREIRDLGYNTIRLPLSDQVVWQNPIVQAGVAAEPSLLGLHALTVLDLIIRDAATMGLRVILDNHRSEAGWSAERNGLWYNNGAGYPESTWLNDWRILAALSLGWPNVIGVDLRNEPHTLGSFPWSVSAYKRGATWGTGDPTYEAVDPLNTYCTVASNCHDWRLAAERAGDAILAINPKLLIFVEGTELYRNGSTIDENWWGGNLEGAARYPVQLVVNGGDVTTSHLVYSPHEYGPAVFKNPEFGPSTSPSTLHTVWNRFWGYLAKPSSVEGVPVLLGEFGTCTWSPTCTGSTQSGSQGQWFTVMISYLQAHPRISWCYWALNGTQSPAPNRHSGAREGYGILDTSWTGVADADLQNALASIQSGPSPAASESSPRPRSGR